jgi:6-phosphogluconolactonase (cycloisomerase 2 family)
MKMGRCAWALAATTLLTGCGNFWQAPSSSSGSSSTLSSGVFYVANKDTDQIAAFSIVSGALTQVSGSPYSLGSAPFAIAVAPNGSFLYVSTAEGIFLYTISSGGGLTLANSSAAISADLATAMQVDSTDHWLIESGPDVAELIAIPINSSTGVPTSTTEQEALLPAATAQQLIISPDNDNVFVALGADGTEQVAFNSSSGTPFGTESNIAVKNSAGAALSVAVDPSSRMVYIGETAATSGSNSGGIRAFTYSTMAEVSGSPYASGGLAPYSILPLSSGDYVYVANRTVSGSTDGNITGFSVTTSGSAYSLTALSTTAAAGIDPVALAADSDGNYLLAVDSGGSPDLEAYTFDTTTAGKLDSSLTGATGTDPVEASAIAAAP